MAEPYPPPLASTSQPLPPSFTSQPLLPGLYFPASASQALLPSIHLPASTSHRPPLSLYLHPSPPSLHFPVSTSQPPPSSLYFQPPPSSSALQPHPTLQLVAVTSWAIPQRLCLAIAFLDVLVQENPHCPGTQSRGFLLQVPREIHLFLHPHAFSACI